MFNTNLGRLLSGRDRLNKDDRNNFSVKLFSLIQQIPKKYITSI